MRGSLRLRLAPLETLALLGAVVLGLVAIFARVIAPYDPVAQDIPRRFSPVGSSGHLLGTDMFGRDVLSRLLYGIQTELAIAIASTLIAAFLGVSLGLLAGYFRGWTETVSMRTIDILLSFPNIVLALLIVTVGGPGWVTLVASMSAIFTPVFARLTYGQTLAITRAEYVDAAKAFGARPAYALLRVVLPNAIGPALIQLSLTIAAAIVLESGLSFLGLGVTPPSPSLGLMIADGQRYLTANSSTLVVPAAAIAVVILIFGLLGEALRARFDPRRDDGA